MYVIHLVLAIFNTLVIFLASAYYIYTFVISIGLAIFIDLSYHWHVGIIFYRFIILWAINTFNAFGLPLGIDVFKLVFHNQGRLLYFIPLSYPWRYYICTFLTSRQEFIILILRLQYSWDLPYLIRLLHTSRLLYVILSVTPSGFIIFNPLVTPLRLIILNILVIFLGFIIFNALITPWRLLYIYTFIIPRLLQY